MRRILVVLVAAMVSLSMVGVGSAGAEPTGFSTELLGTNEVPTGDPDGTGMGQLTIDPATGEVCFDLRLFNVDTPTAAHIHTGVAGVNGPVLVNFDVPGNGLDGCVTTTTTNASAIVADPAGYYVNVHNVAYPGGAVRGQLVAGDVDFPSIQGTVSDAASSDPIAGAQVRLYSTTETGWRYYAATDGSGGYSFTGLPSGSFKMQIADPSGQHASQWWDGQPRWVDGGVITVVGGQVAEVNPSLVPVTELGTLTVDVYEYIDTWPPSGPALPGSTVQVYTTEGQVAAGVTDGAGRVTFPNLPPGQYFARASSPGYLSGWIGGFFGWPAPKYAWADSFTVNAGSTTYIDGHLPPESDGASISGTVTDRSTGLPVAGATVRLYVPEGFEVMATTTTDASGSYSFVDQYPENFIVVALAGGYVPTWFGDVGWYLDATELEMYEGDVAIADITLPPS